MAASLGTLSEREGRAARGKQRAPVATGLALYQSLGSAALFVVEAGARISPTFPAQHLIQNRLLSAISPAFREDLHWVRTRAQKNAAARASSNPTTAPGVLRHYERQRTEFQSKA